MSLSSFGCERKCISLLGERSQPFSSDRKILRIGKSDCLAVEVSNKPNTRLFAGGFRNGSILIANADELRNYSDPKDCILEFKMKSSISRICFLNDDQYMLSSSVNGDINLWDFRLPGKPLKTLEGNVNEYKILPSAIHESSEQYFAALGDDRKIRIWDIWGFNVHPIFEYHAPFNVNSLEFDSNSELKLCLATDDGIKMIKVI
jgi:WD40 repeat protein